MGVLRRGDYWSVLDSGGMATTTTLASQRSSTVSTVWPRKGRPSTFRSDAPSTTRSASLSVAASTSVSPGEVPSTHLRNGIHTHLLAQAHRARDQRVHHLIAGVGSAAASANAQRLRQHRPAGVHMGEHDFGAETTAHTEGDLLSRT